MDGGAPPEAGHPSIWHNLSEVAIDSLEQEDGRWVAGGASRRVRDAQAEAQLPGIGTFGRTRTRDGQQGFVVEGRSRPGIGLFSSLAAGLIAAARNVETLWGVLIGCILGSAYVATLLPGVYTFGDTTKFQYLGRILGTPHSTGYPTYLVLNHLFVRLWPFGSLAQKANLLSAVFTVVAAVVLFKLLLALKVDPFLAVVTSLTFGFTRTVWTQSVIAEVYTLNLLFVASTVSCLVVWHLQRRDRYLCAGLAIYALSFGNHLTMITILPAIAWLILATDASSLLRLRNVAMTAAFIALGGLQYSYIFWRTSVEHPGFLEMRATTLEELWWWVRGGPFTGRMFAFPVEEVVAERLPMAVSFFWGDYGVLTPVMLLGVVALKNVRLNVFLLLCAAGNLFYAINYDVGDVFVYFIPTYFIAAVYLGLGLDSVGRLVARVGTVLVASGYRWATPPHPGSDQPTLALARAPFVLVPWMLVLANLNAVDQSENTAAAAATEAILQEVGANAVIITEGYHYSDYQSLMYYLYGEGREKDKIYALWAAQPDAVVAYLCEGRPLSLPLQKLEVPPGLDVYALRPPAGIDRVGLCTETGPDCAFSMGTGWHDPETTDPLWWRWTDGSGQVRVFAERDMEVSMGGWLGSRQHPDRVEVLVNDRVARTLDVTSVEAQSLGPIPLQLHAGENIVEFRSHHPAIRLPNAPRRLAVVVHQLSITGGGTVPVCDLLL
ncbi:MAG: DUF2723 domain-containing protein [Chloroflexota bacterium]|nr:DUF2723 domain-containing protein [Chloroflexota bacterium]